MKYPVIAYDGITYEKDNIIDYLTQHKKTPNSVKPLNSSDDVINAISLLFDDIQLKMEIDSL